MHTHRKTRNPGTMIIIAALLAVVITVMAYLAYMFVYPNSETSQKSGISILQTFVPMETLTGETT